MATMSITQGLAELKLLDKRLAKRLDGVAWTAVSTKTKKVDAEELKKTASSEYHSYMDLVLRRDTIKRAIVLSNAATLVSIGKWTGTVAEAIEHKSSIVYKKKLLEKMKQNSMTTQEEFQAANEEVTLRLDRLLSSELGKDIKTNPETIASLTASFQETNKVVLVDPLGLKKMIADLEEEIDSFETNVDWVLSETNGKTQIKI
jgi:TATA-box binding protein (TBP) (component of TFIID and TFIIIB)